MALFLPKPYKKEQITIRVENRTLAKIDSLASKYHLSRNEFINQCIDFALDNMNSQEEE